MPRDYAALPFNELYEMQAVEKDHPKWNVDEIYDYNQRKKRVEKLSRLKTAAVDGNIDAIPYGELQDFAVDEQGKNGLTAQKEVEAILNPDKAAAAEAMQGYLSELEKLEKLYDGNHAPKETQPPIAQVGATVQPLTQPLAVVEETATVPTYGSAQAVDVGAGGNTNDPLTVPPGEGAANGAADGGNVEPPSDTETKDPQSTANGILSFSQWLDRFGVDADEQHQAALKLAYDEYARALSTYGRQAEQLAQAGLTNSGVSDNVQRAAYAQKQTALQNAQALKNQTEATNRSQYAAYVDTKEAQLEAQEKAEAEKTKAENESKDLLQSEYNQLYYNLLKGYVDEDGKKYAPLSHEQAVASMKNLYGYTDEAMLASAKESYDAVTQAENDAKESIAVQFGGGTVGDNGATIGADSLLGKLINSDIDEEDFLDEVSEYTGKEYDADEDGFFNAVDDLYSTGYITKAQRHEYHLRALQATLTEVESKLKGGKIRKDLKSAGEDGEKDGMLYNVIANAYDAYKEGRLSDQGWDEFRRGILSGDSDVSISLDSIIGNLATSSNVDTKITVNVGDENATFFVGSTTGFFGTGTEMYQKLDALSKGSGLLTYNGELYIKSTSGKMEYWYKIGAGNNTKKQTLVEILTLLGTPTKK